MQTCEPFSDMEKRRTGGECEWRKRKLLGNNGFCMQTQIFLRQENGQKQAYKKSILRTASAVAFMILPTIKHGIDLFSYVFSEKVDACPLLLAFLSRSTLSVDRAWRYALSVDQLSSIRLSRGLSREFGRYCSHVSSSVLDDVSPFARANV